MGTAFIVIGSLIAIAGLVWLAWTAAFMSRAAKAPGQVIAMERSEGSEKDSAVYHPVFTFVDSAGIVHTQRSSFGSSRYSFEVGELVTIRYDSTTPKHSKMESFQTVWLGPIIVTGFGLLFGGFACFWLFMWTRAARLPKQ